MIPVPFPPDTPGARCVIGEPGMNPAATDAPMPVEYLLGHSTLYPGRYTFTTRLVLQQEDLNAIAAGARHLLLTLDGAEVPWSLTVEGSS